MPLLESKQPLTVLRQLMMFRCIRKMQSPKLTHQIMGGSLEASGKQAILGLVIILKKIWFFAHFCSEARSAIFLQLRCQQGQDIFSDLVLSNWKNALDRLRNHEKSDSHIAVTSLSASSMISIV